MKLLATCAAFLFSGIVAAAPLKNAVVFGDSLSDNGNLYEFMKHQLPQSPPYFNGRFSNGRVWVEFLMDTYFSKGAGTHLLDYAYGGAGVSEEEGDDDLFTLKREVATYLLANQDKASEDSLYILWIGANNYLGLPTETEKTLKAVNDGITHSLKKLADKGAKHFLVMNIPDLGRIPAATEFNAVDTLSYYSRRHNEDLEKTMIQLKEEYPDVNWIYYDMNSMFTYLLEHPSEYGITNITGTCVNSVMQEVTKKSVLNIVANTHPSNRPYDCSGFLYFDLVHPTVLAHKIMADKVRGVLDEYGISFVVPEEVN
jgi:phospholipase/lecithinase/hemolysin